MDWMAWLEQQAERARHEIERHPQALRAMCFADVELGLINEDQSDPAPAK